MHVKVCRDKPRGFHLVHRAVHRAVHALARFGRLQLQLQLQHFKTGSDNTSEDHSIFIQFQTISNLIPHRLHLSLISLNITY